MRRRKRVVDLFSGWGGFSEGAKGADCEIVRADNHWQLAVDVHRMNHPDAEHVCQDLNLADWRTFPEYDILLASPACQGHSEASQPGRRAYHATQRATAWAVVDCVENTEPRAFAVENVPQFVEWKQFDLWMEALERCGYFVTQQVIRASYCGTPQRRDRLIVVGSRRAPIHLHVPPAPEPAFGPCVDWNAGNWRPIRTCRGEAALERLKAAGKRFNRALVQHVTGHRGVGDYEPIRTITTKDQWVAYRNGYYRPLLLREYARAMGFPESYRWPDGLRRDEVVRGIGNAVCVQMGETVVRQIVAAA